MTTIGSSSPSGTSIYSNYTIAPYGARILTGEALEKARAESEEFTKAHAHLGAKDYIKAMLENSERKAPEQLASGFATSTIKVRLDDRTYTLAGTKLELSPEQMTKIPETPSVEVQQPEDAPLQLQTQAQLLNLQEVEEASGETAASPILSDGLIKTFSRADWSFNLLNERLRQVG